MLTGAAAATNGIKSVERIFLIARQGRRFLSDQPAAIVTLGLPAKSLK